MVNSVNTSAASKESATTVNVNDSSNNVPNVVNPSAASKRSVTPKEKPTKPTNKPNAAPKRGVTPKDLLNDNSSGGATVINYNHVSENVIQYNHGETLMEISYSSDNLSKKNSNGNNSSENNSTGNSHNNNLNSANNGNNETVIVKDVNEVNAEMTPVVTSTPVERPDVHMGPPPPFLKWERLLECSPNTFPSPCVEGLCILLNM